MSEAGPVDPLALETQFCFAVTLTSRNIVAAYRPVLEPLGLTHPQYLVMLALWEDAPLSVKTLSALLQLDPGTVSPLVKRLEAIGYVERRRDEKDERVLAIALTPAGAALRHQAESVPGQMLERLGMDLTELQALQRSLMKVSAAARAAGGD